jgi:hypothetical protein
MPAGLGASGIAFWRAVVRVYELSPAEVLMLEQCCRQADLIDRLDAALAAGDVIVEGSMGQPRLHPGVAAVAEARRTLDGLQRALSLPMPDEELGRRRSPQQTAAAQARWRARDVRGG